MMGRKTRVAVLLLLGLGRPIWAAPANDVIVPVLPPYSGPIHLEGTSDPDVLVLYTAEAALAAGGIAAIEQRIRDADAFRLSAYARSAMTTAGGVLHVRPFARPESGRLHTELTTLQTDPTVAALRDDLGADVVALITGRSGQCGIGYLMTELSPAFADFAFSVTDQACLPSTYAHELGHNQGCLHDPNNSGGGFGVTNFAFGHRECVTGGFRTIMSYPCPGLSIARIANYSNPRVTTADGQPTGTTAPDCTVYGACRDCARAIDLTAPLVAGFRPRPGGTTTSTSTPTTTTSSTSTTDTLPPPPTTTSSTTVTVTTIPTTTTLPTGTAPACVVVDEKQVERLKLPATVSRKDQEHADVGVFCTAGSGAILLLLDHDELLCTLTGTSTGTVQTAVFTAVRCRSRR